MIALVKVCATLAVLVSLARASPVAAKTAFWQDTSLDSSVEQMRSMCSEDDPIACLKFKAFSFLNSILQKDNFQISDNVEVNRNSYRTNEVTSRSDDSIENTVENYVKTHDATFKLPIANATVTLGARSLDSDEVDLKLNFGGGAGQVQARKSKLKKIVTPILVFLLLKAMTLVPFALGALALKAWNALQLSFFSFVVAVGLAIFQLCKKIGADNSHPQISAHAPWEPPAFSSHYAARSLSGEETAVNDGAQKMAYAAHVPQ